MPYSEAFTFLSIIRSLMITVLSNNQIIFVLALVFKPLTLYFRIFSVLENSHHLIGKAKIVGL